MIFYFYYEIASCVRIHVLLDVIDGCTIQCVHVSLLSQSMTRVKIQIRIFLRAIFGTIDVQRGRRRMQNYYFAIINLQMQKHILSSIEAAI